MRFPLRYVGMALALGIAGTAMVLTGAAILTGPDESCIQAIELHEKQYATLEKVLPLAAEAVEAAAARSQTRLNASSADTRALREELDRQEPALNKAVEECRG